MYELEVVAFPYLYVFGEYQDPYSCYAAVIPKFIRLMHAGEHPRSTATGWPRAIFTQVANVADANIAAADATNAAGLTMNVATGISHTLLELVATLNKLIGTSASSNPSTLIPDRGTYW